MKLTAARFVPFALLALGSGAVAQQASVSARYEQGEQAHWVFEQAGQGIGHCWSRYEGPANLAGVRAHRFRARVALNMELPSGVLDQRMTSELWTDDRGRPLHFVMHTSLSDAYSGIEIGFAGDKARASIRQGPSETDREVEIVEGSYLLANNFVAHMELLLVREAPGEGETAQLDLFSANVLQNFPLTLEHTGTFVGTGGQPGGSVFQDSLGETLHFSDEGELLTVEIPAQELTMRRVDEPAEPFEVLPPAPVEPADFDREEVTIEHGEVAIAGTITRPKGREGPLPAVFFVSGSGAQDRDGYAGGIDIGTHEILDRLTADGFCVLRVDDRGAGATRGPTEGLSFEDLVEDARQCVEYLRAREDVDAERVAIIGHSEGGQTAPILAAEVEGIAAIVLMAAPGRPLPELTREQLVRGKREAGESEEDIAKFEEAVKSFFERIAVGETVTAEDAHPDLAFLLPMQAWLRSHSAQDPRANISRVECPILLLQGARDIQVLAEKDATALAGTLEEAQHADHELVVFPELDHLFKKTVGEKSSGLDYFKSRPVDAEFLDKLSAWLGERLLR